IVTLEPLILLALVPFLWFPRPGSALVLVLVPLLWAVRRAATGRWSVRTSYDLPIVAMLVLLPLSLMPVVDWSLATPRLYVLLLGVAMPYALANALASRRQVLIGVYATVIVVGSAVVAAGMFGAEWLQGKILPLEPIYDRLPRIGQRFALSRGTY